MEGCNLLQQDGGVHLQQDGGVQPPAAGWRGATSCSRMEGCNLLQQDGGVQPRAAGWRGATSCSWMQGCYLLQLDGGVQPPAAGWRGATSRKHSEGVNMAYKVKKSTNTYTSSSACLISSIRFRRYSLRNSSSSSAICSRNSWSFACSASSSF